MYKTRIVPFFSLTCFILILPVLVNAQIEKCIEFPNALGPNCQRCDGEWCIFQGETKELEFFGHWLDFTETVSCGAKVSGSILHKKNGLENSVRGYGPIGSVKIRFKADHDARTGNRTIRLKRDRNNQTEFTLRVLPRAWVNDGQVVTPLEGSFSEAYVDITGTGLDRPSIRSVNLYLDPNHPVVDGESRRRDPGEREIASMSIGSQILGYTNTKVQTKLTFPLPLKEATIDLRLTSAGRCNPLYAPTDAIGGHLRRVKLKAKLYPMNKPNYVSEIEFRTNDSGIPSDRFNVGENFFARIKFKRPGRLSAIRIESGRVTGDTFYWRMVPPQNFVGIAPTTYQPRIRNKVHIPQREDKVDLYISGQAGSGQNVTCSDDSSGRTICESRCWIETWVGDDFRNSGPGYYREELFIVYEAR